MIENNDYIIDMKESSEGKPKAWTNQTRKGLTKELFH